MARGESAWRAPELYWGILETAETELNLLLADTRS